MFVGCYLLSRVCCVLFVVDGCAVFVVALARCGLSVCWESLFVVRCLSFVGCCMLVAVGVPLCAACCCLVCVVCCCVLLVVVGGGGVGRVLLLCSGYCVFVVWRCCVFAMLRGVRCVLRAVCYSCVVDWWFVVCLLLVGVYCVLFGVCF